MVNHIKHLRWTSVVLSSFLAMLENPLCRFLWGLSDRLVALFFGYPPDSVFKQSIYTGFEEINKKVNNPEEIVNYYHSNLESLGYFVNAKSNLKWVIDSEYIDEQINSFLNIVSELISKIKESGLQINGGGITRKDRDRSF